MSKLEEEIIYNGRILDLAREIHRMPDRREARFEIIRHPGGAAALPVMDDGRLILIRQFRPAAEDYIFEVPAGRLEPGEDGPACIDRELIEEIGFRAATIEPLGAVYSSVGFCNEQIHLFLASGLSPAETAHEPDEYIESVVVSLDQALQMIETGQIKDAKTQLCLLRYALRKRPV